MSCGSVQQCSEMKRGLVYRKGRILYRDSKYFQRLFLFTALQEDFPCLVPGEYARSLVIRDDCGSVHEQILQPHYL
ncbi:hypothetical protein AB205_0164270 [Aquarana catesbeiana]|uniref:Uncharacterized protein n=1 Tax=Aquarana catesbeiana TaxID=8400 RepID=A0A2G9SKD0_AQUCT|nr:hypothetical protein AB205_0164270 [Aquarana catesbeiana]